MVPTLEVLPRNQYRNIHEWFLNAAVQSLERDAVGMNPDRSDPKKLRRYPRYSLDVRVSVRVFRPGSPIELWGRSIEMGPDGIGVTLTGQLEMGEVATLELTLPASSTPLKLRALVRYRDGLRHGFEFLARDAAQQELILKTCDVLSLHD